MTYDYNKTFGLFKFESGYRKFYLNNPTGYSRKIISAQTGERSGKHIYKTHYVHVGESSSQKDWSVLASKISSIGSSKSLRVGETLSRVSTACFSSGSRMTVIISLKCI